MLDQSTSCLIFYFSRSMSDWQTFFLFMFGRNTKWHLTWRQIFPAYDASQSFFSILEMVFDGFQYASRLKLRFDMFCNRTQLNVTRPFVDCSNFWIPVVFFLRKICSESDASHPVDAFSSNVLCQFCKWKVNEWTMRICSISFQLILKNIGQPIG